MVRKCMNYLNDKKIEFYFFLKNKKMNIKCMLKKYPYGLYDKLSVFKFYTQPDQIKIEKPLFEPITQLDHAIQTANNVRFQLEKLGKRNKHLEVAGALHDIGHFIQFGSKNSRLVCINPQSGINDFHEIIGADFLKQKKFPMSITEPIRYHGVAKIWLCNKDALYYSSLSKASKMSLEIQKQTCDKEYQDFLKSRYRSQAILLRRCDDMSKQTLMVRNPYYKDLDDLLKLVTDVFTKE
jgi:predicted HD phosphohydrolase